jgi:hypothetical protein
MSLVTVKTTPLTRPYPCRAFYDTIGDTLSAGVKQRGQFKQTIDGSDCSFDLTREGKILNIDVWRPRKLWRIEAAIHPPEEFLRTNVALLTNTENLSDIEYLTDQERSLLNIRFARGRVARFVSPATSLIVELNEQSELIGLWLLGIVDDVNFVKEGEWRRSIKAI